MSQSYPPTMSLPPQNGQKQQQMNPNVNPQIKKYFNLWTYQNIQITLDGKFIFVHCQLLDTLASYPQGFCIEGIQIDPINFCCDIILQKGLPPIKFELTEPKIGKLIESKENEKKGGSGTGRGRRSKKS